MIIAYILKDCYYSESAEKLLKKNKIKFIKHLVPQDENIKNKLKKKNKMNTFPQIFFKDDNILKIFKIGGYNDFNQYFDLKKEIKDKKLNKNLCKYII